jgi:hypothetical protein
MKPERQHFLIRNSGSCLLTPESLILTPAS